MPRKICQLIRDLKPEVFFRKLCLALQEMQHQAGFRDEWSQWRGRTRILLGRGKSRDNALLARVLREWGVPITDQGVSGDLSFERYGDLIYFCDGWHEGQSHPEFHIEVENNPNEWRGTISDLLYVQSHLKVAIFFGDPKDSLQAWGDVLREYPFKPDASCRYMVITLPTDVEDEFPVGATAHWTEAAKAAETHRWTSRKWS
jgi:hypothetical protein